MKLFNPRLAVNDAVNSRPPYAEFLGEFLGRCHSRPLLDFRDLFFCQFCFSSASIVFCVRYSLKMIWAYTAWIAAKVIDSVSLWNGLAAPFIHYAACLLNPSIPSHASVTTRAFSPIPYPAAGSGVNVVIKTWPKVVGGDVADRMPLEDVLERVRVFCDSRWLTTTAHAEAGRVGRIGSFVFKFRRHVSNLLYRLDCVRLGTVLDAPFRAACILA